MARESKVQSDFVKWLRERGCVVCKQDPTTGRQKGFPDLLVLYKTRWMAFEMKRHSKATFRPGQEEWLYRLSEWSIAKMVCPENMEEIKAEINRLIEEEDEETNKI